MPYPPNEGVRKLSLIVLEMNEQCQVMKRKVNEYITLFLDDDPSSAEVIRALTKMMEDLQSLISVQQGLMEGQEELLNLYRKDLPDDGA
jgi:hypothetical protein